MSCDHEGESCPVHGEGFYERDFATVLECLFGEVETKAGTPFDRSDAEAVVERVVAQL
jgi:hypothetical protein